MRLKPTEHNLAPVLAVLLLVLLPTAECAGRIFSEINDDITPQPAQAKKPSLEDVALRTADLGAGLTELRPRRQITLEEKAATMQREEMKHRATFFKTRNHTDPTCNMYSLVARIMGQRAAEKAKTAAAKAEAERSAARPSTLGKASNATDLQAPKLFDGLLKAAVAHRALPARHQLLVFDFCAGDVLRTVLAATASLLGDTQPVVYLNSRSDVGAVLEARRGVVVNQLEVDIADDKRRTGSDKNSMHDVSKLHRDFHLAVATIGHPIQLRHAQFLRLSSKGDLGSLDFQSWVAGQPDNFLVRRFCGVACTDVPRGLLTRHHLQLALEHLAIFDVVIDQANLPDGLAVLVYVLDRWHSSSSIELQDWQAVEMKEFSLQQLLDTEHLYTWDLLFYEHAAVRARLLDQELHLLYHEPMNLPCSNATECGCGPCTMF